QVFVNEKKFACESCIKGHRSSSCAHADRPLFEVKKKGRPVSQCEQCRELRKTRQVHSKCICATKDTKKPAVRRLTANCEYTTARIRITGVTDDISLAKRSIPVQPTLPNGLKDVYPEPDAEDGSSGMKSQLYPIIQSLVIFTDFGRLKWTLS
ncbi:copper-fist-domain-containing protein, partial [Panus rudis PR-1116 ss-1]